MVGQQKPESYTKPFFSYAQLRSNFVLIENNLLEYLEGSQNYKTTEKGLNFLKMHNEIGELTNLNKRTKNIRNKLLFPFFTLFFYFSYLKI